jgi:hypothetical protein
MDWEALPVQIAEQATIPHQLGNISVKSRQQVCKIPSYNYFSFYFILYRLDDKRPDGRDPHHYLSSGQIFIRRIHLV